MQSTTLATAAMPGHDPVQLRALDAADGDADDVVGAVEREAERRQRHRVGAAERISRPASIAISQSRASASGSTTASATSSHTVSTER